ncbi:hypothetical protein GINT2_000640 [Glugoides intestinalis]
MTEEKSLEMSSSTPEQDQEIERHNNFHDINEKKEKQLFNRSLSLITSIATLLFLLFISAYSRDMLLQKNKGSDSDSLKYLLYWTSAFICILNAFSIIYFLILIIKMFISHRNPQSLFIPSILKNFVLEISLVITLWLCNFIVPLEKYFSTRKETKEKILFAFPSWRILKSAPESLLIKGNPVLDNCIPAIMRIILVFVLKKLVIYILNFNIHYRYYKRRIDINTDKLRIMKIMNEAVGTEYTSDVDAISAKFINFVSSGGKLPVILTTLRTYFNDENSYKIFDYCNRDGNAELTVEEIIEFYVSTIVEQNAIAKNIEQHNSTVESFKHVLDVITASIGIYNILTIIPLYTLEDVGICKNVNVLAASFLTMNYVFSESIKTFVNNLSFIFIIRPYEISDLILVKDKLMKVHNINLFTTVLFDGDNYILVPNMKLSADNITNLRLNRVFEVEFTNVFKQAEFEKKSAELLMKITEYTSKKSSEFRHKPIFKDIKQTEKGGISATLVVRLNSEVSDIEVLMKRKTKTFFIIQDMIKEVGLSLFSE